jgi:hypothetical protein
MEKQKATCATHPQNDARVHEFKDAGLRMCHCIFLPPDTTYLIQDGRVIEIIRYPEVGFSKIDNATRSQM